VVTEYDLPRGGQHDIWMLRGDPHYVWPHDVIMNDQYAYYTDHFSYTIGRLDRKTGEVKELQFEGPPGAGRDPNGGDGRPGNPGGGTHELQFDPQGNVIIGMRKGTVRYNPVTNRFNGWAAGSDQFGLDPQGNTWTLAANGQLMKLDTSTEALKRTIYPIPKNAGIYDIDTDSKSRTDLYIWREGKVGIFDPANLEYKDYPTPTPMSGPRRGQIDAQNRLWAAEFYAGQVLMFDPDHQQLKEYPLIEGVKPYTAPYAEPYSASVDDKNHVVWTNDFSSSRIYKIDTVTGKSVEYMTPSNYEIRDFKVEVGAPRPTVWIPAYRPPSKLVKVQVR
jgi:streptogramin lyase